MSDDIVARLRNAKWTDDEVFGDAADEIERLRDELAAEWELNEDLTTAYMVAFEKGKDAIRAERDELRAELAAAEAIASFGEDDRIQAYFQKWKRENDKTLRLRAERDAMRAELAAENETVMRLTAELSGVKACLKSLEKHFARAKGNTQSMKLSRNAARSERDTLRELLRECRSGWYLNEELNARIDAALKGDDRE